MAPAARGRCSGWRRLAPWKFNLGVVRVRLGQRDAALDAFERAAQHDDTREQARKEIEEIKDGPRPARSSRPGLPR